MRGIMNNGRKEYTFLWFIENYSCCWHKNGKKIISPSFTIDKLEGTTWTLELYPRGMDDEDKDEMSIFLRRSESSDGPKNIHLNNEMSLLAADGSTICSENLDYTFKRDDSYGGSLFDYEELLRKKVDCLPQDTLTVCCKIWKGEGKVDSIGQSSARTRIRIEKNSFLHEVERFSRLQPNVKQTTKIRSHSKKGRFISISLYFIEEKIMTEIVLPSTDQILCKCELSLLDGSGNVIECGGIDNRYEAERKNIYEIPLSLTREAVLTKKSELLPDDKLSLICECIFSSGIEFQTIEETLNGIPSALIKQKSNNANGINKNENEASEKLSKHPSALEDIKTLYINQFLTDVEVKTETKSFVAHKNILSARSPVFKTMLTTEMKEKITDCIHIDDLENSIVHQLLLFLYSDNIEDLQWETAPKLYYAADKYQIGKLREVCSSFLVENLTTTNAGELLLLADTHNDSDLRKSVEDFILENDEEVFGSKEWETLMETNPLLFMKTMHLKYKRKNLS